jgi:hypothetical protein
MDCHICGYGNINFLLICTDCNECVCQLHSIKCDICHSNSYVEAAVCDICTKIMDNIKYCTKCFVKCQNNIQERS